MLVMIRWLMTIRAGTMIARWASVADKFSPDLDLRKRLAKSCDRSGKAEGCRKWIYSWRAESTGRISAPWNVAFRALPFE